MTTPTERQHVLLQVGAYLKQLAADTTLPEHIRAEAVRLLRHYPRRSELRYLDSVADLPLPETEEQEELLRGYKYGAHDGP